MDAHTDRRLVPVAVESTPRVAAIATARHRLSSRIARAPAIHLPPHPRAASPPHPDRLARGEVPAR
ncbi:MAG: hypothetical protein RLZZ565_369, partial [Planctomycetota bacterium]